MTLRADTSPDNASPDDHWSHSLAPVDPRLRKARTRAARRIRQALAVWGPARPHGPQRDGKCTRVDASLDLARARSAYSQVQRPPEREPEPRQREGERPGVVWTRSRICPSTRLPTAATAHTQQSLIADGTCRMVRVQPEGPAAHGPHLTVHDFSQIRMNPPRRYSGQIALHPCRVAVDSINWTMGFNSQ